MALMLINDRTGRCTRLATIILLIMIEWVSRNLLSTRCASTNLYGRFCPNGGVAELDCGCGLSRCTTSAPGGCCSMN